MLKKSNHINRILIFIALMAVIVFGLYLIIKYINNQDDHLVIDKSCTVDYSMADYPPLACYNITSIEWVFKEKGLWITQWEKADSGIYINVGNEVGIKNLDQVEYNQDWLYIKDGHYYSVFMDNIDKSFDMVVPYSKLNTKTKELVIYEFEGGIPQEERLLFKLR